MGTVEKLVFKFVRHHLYNMCLNFDLLGVVVYIFGGNVVYEGAVFGQCL